MEELAQRFARYLEHRIEGAESVRIDSIDRIHGGASRETYRVHATVVRRGEPEAWAVILRRDPPSSLIETERAKEYHAYRAFFGTAVPVPEPLWLEEDPKWLERPFFVMREIQGCESSLAAFGQPPYLEHREQLGRQCWTILGEIARTDPAAVGLEGALEPVAADACWSRELAHWEQVIDSDEVAPQPVARAAIRWLRRHPPPPAQAVRVVHGDYRSGNFLFDAEGRIRGILDWEMCHLGDPLEDLAWSLNPIWSWPQTELAGRLLPRERALKIWEETSGLRADPRALAWWELFASLKCLAIWISSIRECVDRRSRDPLLILVGWYLHRTQEEIILDQMEALA